MAGSARRGGFYSIGGRDYVSVTTVLRVIDKPFLTDWKAKEAVRAMLADPKNVDTPEKALAAVALAKDHAADRGSGVHAIAEAYAGVYSGRATGPAAETAGTADPYYPAVDAFFRAMKPVVLETELTVYHPEHGYAGTLDLLAEMQDGLSYVVDYKTSKAVYPEHALQVEAYRRCTRAVPELDASRAARGERGLADMGAVVLLRPDGTYTWNPVRGDFEAFLAAKRLWEWREGGR